MASPYTKIKRTIEYLKSYLDYYRKEYNDAAKSITNKDGWQISDEEAAEALYNAMFNLDYMLYNELYPKLTDEVPATDDEIIDYINGLIVLTEHQLTLLFNRSLPNDSAYNTLSGIVISLLHKAFYQFEEAIKLAKEDRENFPSKTEAANQDDNYDIGIITATIEELEAVKLLFKDTTIIPSDDDDAHTYYSGYFQNDTKKLRVIVARCLHQGTAASATLTTKLNWKYTPNFIAMLGHAAGNRNLMREQKIGDIMVAQEAIDYDQVSVIVKKDADNNPYTTEKDRKHSISSNASLIDKIEQYASNTDILTKIKANYEKQELFEHPVSLKYGKIISGNALVRSQEWFDKIISENTGTIGLDMETHGFYYAVENTFFKKKPVFLSIKSVSDFGSEQTDYPKPLKSHAVRVPYATYTSANFFYNFALDHLPL